MQRNKSAVSQAGEERKAAKVNGWVLCLREAFTDPALPGESVSGRYERLRAHAKRQFEDPEVRKAFSLRAKEENRRIREHQRAAESQGGLMSLLEESAGSQVGPWGAGDSEFPVSKASIASSLGQKAFVKKGHKKFCAAQTRAKNSVFPEAC